VKFVTGKIFWKHVTIQWLGVFLLMKYLNSATNQNLAQNSGFQCLHGCIFLIYRRYLLFMPPQNSAFDPVSKGALDQAAEIIA